MWEYKIVCKHLWCDDLDSLGSEGWELCGYSVTPTQFDDWDNYEYIFKRWVDEGL